jgi:Uma2 family endonuclease
MTPEEFDDRPEWHWDDRFRYELIRGILVVTPIAGPAERDPEDYLGYLLRLHQETHPQGSAIDATLFEQYLAVGGDRRRCDRAIWTGLGRLPDLEKDIPSIVIEFVSASRRDRLRDYEEKLREYTALGVKEYWIIDRFRRIMTVHQNRPAGVATLVVAEAGSYQTDLLPGFVLPLARLLARADDWPRKTTRKRRPPAPGAE